MSAILRKNNPSLKIQKHGEPPFSLEPAGSSARKQNDITDRIISDS